MNENEITKRVANALREAWRTNHWMYMEESVEDAADSVLYDVAVNLAKEIWPNQSEESPVMPEEWAAAIK